MNTFIADLVARSVESQGLYRYKDSITLVLVAVVWVAAFALTYFTGMPIEASGLIGVVGNFAGALVVRLTPGAITPSMERRLEELAGPTEKGEHHAAGSWLDQARARMAQR